MDKLNPQTGHEQAGRRSAIVLSLLPLKDNVQLLVGLPVQELPNIMTVS